MPLKHGFSPQVIRDNIRAEIRAGRSPSQAIAMAYEQAREDALEEGDMERYEALVGADLPADIARMNAEEAMAELSRLDNLLASRGLTEAENKRMLNVELRLEQLSGYQEPERDWSYYQALAERESKGEDPFNSKALEGYKGPVTNIDLTLKESKMGLWPLAILAGIFIFAKKAGKK